MSSPLLIRKDAITGCFSLFQTLNIECGRRSSEHRAALATARLVLVIITADSLQGRSLSLSCSCSPRRPARLEQKPCLQGSVLVQVKAEYHPYQATKYTSVLECDIQNVSSKTQSNAEHKEINMLGVHLPIVHFSIMC
jgi:hypothetical protein